MKKLLVFPVFAAFLVALSAKAETPAACKDRCDNRYDQCVKDAVEYGYDRVTAKAGCQEKRDACKKKC